MTSQHSRYPLPPDLPEDVAAIWLETVERGRIAPSVSPELLEAYCDLVVRWRQAARVVTDEGLVVDGGEKRGAIVHPALAAERQLSDQIKQWSPLVHRPVRADRKRGPMYDATKASIKAAGLEERDEFKGVCTAVLTQAWLIDEAQRAGLEELQKAAYVLIPSYVKGCAELQITPASLPPEAAKTKDSEGGKVSKFEDAAERRRRRAA